MDPGAPRPISINDALDELTFLPARTPTTTAEESRDAFTLLSPYRDGGIVAGHWAGNSEWERHTAGDEIVMVLEGHTTVSFLVAQEELAATLRTGELVIVPQGTWHRFETPERVKLLAITPQPTDHEPERPS